MMKKGFFCKVQLFVLLSAVFLSNGCGSSSSDSAPPDTTAPAAPTFLTAVAASSTRVSLRWLASTDNVGVTAYTINRNGTLLVTTTTATTIYSDTTCTANTVYTYSVAARDAAGNESAFSSSATTTTFTTGSGDVDPPNAPTSLTATASSTQITLSWNAASDPGGGVSGYNIYRASALAGPFTLVGSTPATTYSDTSLTSSTTYYYYVRTIDGVPHESLGTSNILPVTTL